MLAGNTESLVKSKIFDNVQLKQFEVSEFFTYGNSFNLSGVLPGIEKDNFESAKLYLTNENGY